MFIIKNNNKVKSFNNLFFLVFVLLKIPSFISQNLIQSYSTNTSTDIMRRQLLENNTDFDNSLMNPGRFSMESTDVFYNHGNYYTHIIEMTPVQNSRNSIPLQCDNRAQYLIYKKQLYMLDKHIIKKFLHDFFNASDYPLFNDKASPIENIMIFNLLTSVQHLKQFYKLDSYQKAELIFARYGINNKDIFGEIHDEYEKDIFLENLIEKIQWDVWRVTDNISIDKINKETGHHTIEIRERNQLNLLKKYQVESNINEKIASQTQTWIALIKSLPTMCIQYMLLTFIITGFIWFFYNFNSV